MRVRVRVCEGCYERLQLLGADLALVEVLDAHHVHRRPRARYLSDLDLLLVHKWTQPHRLGDLAPRAHLGRPARAGGAVGAYARAHGANAAAAADHLGTRAVAAFVEGAPHL